MILELKGIEKSFGEKKVLTKVSLPGSDKQRLLNGWR